MVWDNINDDDYRASSETCGDCGKDLQCYLYGDQIDGSLAVPEMHGKKIQR